MEQRKDIVKILDSHKRTLLVTFAYDHALMGDLDFTKKPRALVIYTSVEGLSTLACYS
ncbi:hypothetical protein ACIAD0614 [Acinetobacter baylyi ADP1]|uniref:Uncharacterized protein n=1 Tax=Acinetobacter baylyi (strain ATCC 33305 / BD413 / ADP1) TaxID=62977 RepID=Q6FEH1_ACIAD|nr:hypothetical protein ACIAD0614 [Acinetobacter baylyi ADP1]